MQKESAKRHHYIPRCYLKRFASGKKQKLDVLVLDANGIGKRINPTITTFLVERGIYDLSSFKASFYPSFSEVSDSLVEDILFAKVHEPIYNNTLKESIDCNLCPTPEQANRITGSVWTFYLRTPRIRRINQEISVELGSQIDDKQKNFIGSFSAITAWSVIKLFPKAFRHTHCTLLNAVGIEKFLTCDHPSIPCLFDYHRGQIRRCDEKALQKSVVLAEQWPEEVSLLCPLSPQWCIISQSIRDLSKISYTPLGSEEVAKINAFIREAAESFVIYPAK